MSINKISLGNKVGKTLLLLLTLSLSLFVSANEKEESTQALLKRARNPEVVASFAKLDGQLQHRRKGQDVQSYNFYFGVIIQKDRATGQIVINDKESYIMSQNRSSATSSVIAQQKKSTNLLNYTGVRASDLTLSFLFYDFVKEVGSERIGAIIDCQVVLLQAKDKSEQVKVWLSKEYAFPMKAEFYKKAKDNTFEKTPFRTLEPGGFTAKEKLYYCRRFIISGPGWKTRIEFDPAKVDVGLFDSAKPVNVIRKIVKK
jgi:outer membrane lipoprotein-sorting protein